MPTALITGVSGQDGSYLAEYLIEKQYIVVGMVRRSSNMSNMNRLINIRAHQNLHLVYGDVTDMASVMHIIKVAKSYLDGNDMLEVYNLAAQSHVKISFESPIYTAQSDAIAVTNILEALIQLDLKDRVKFYQASTSELFGDTPPPQNEQSLLQPVSPYAVSKLYAYWIVKTYRNAYNIFASNGILFNHESERRAENFITRKITKYVAAYKTLSASLLAPLKLGNLYASRDWGYAKDYVAAMWLMLQHDTSLDLVIATNKTHTVKEFCEKAFSTIGVELKWQGSGTDETAVDVQTNATVIEIDPVYFRPAEVHNLQGDASKAFDCIGWKPTTSFDELVKLMVDHDIDLIQTSQQN